MHKIIRLNRHLGISIQIINYFEIKEILLEALNKRDEYTVQVMAQKALKSVQLVAYFNTESASQGLKNSPFFRKRPKTLNPEMVGKKTKNTFGFAVLC